MTNNILDKINHLRENISIIPAGATSKTISLPLFFIKYIVNYKEYNVYEREKHLESILNKFDWYPELLYSDDTNQVFIFKNVGVPLTFQNKPDNFEEQINKILSDMESVNVQHNDIKLGELLIDEDNKIYLCDFGWASVNKEIGCGIGLWNCKNTEKPGGYFEDSICLERLNLINDKLYKDPKRKIGSQSEIPKVTFNDDHIIVSGYQNFVINKKTQNIVSFGKKNKFIYINNLMKKLNTDYNCMSLVDIGCSSGLTSLLALNNNFEHIVSLDHDPEYIDTLRTIKNKCNITKINESVYSFGNTISEKFDVVFCGAIIHWVFSLTADFRSFNSIISYLISLTNKLLIIEWIDPNDGAIKLLNHIKKRRKETDEEYNTHNFENAIKKVSTIISKENADCSTRTIYVLEKL